MKILVAICLFASPLLAQIQQHHVTIYEHKRHDGAASIINAFEAGQRSRYYAEQIKLIEAQRQAFQSELWRAEQEVKDKERAARLARSTPAQSAPPRVTAEQTQQIAKQVDIALELFTAKYPDWKTVEKEMLHFATKVEPKNVSDQEYMEILYVLAKSFLKK